MGREHVLDVKLRSSKARAARARVVAVGLGSVFILLLGTYLLWCAGEWALSQFVYRNRAFAIESIHIETDGILSLEALRRWAAVKPHDNLLAVDLQRVERDLKLVPLIQSVAVDRILPNVLSIRVTEREPIAEIRVPRPRTGGGLNVATYHLDPEGYVTMPLDAAQCAPGAVLPADLPFISGVQSDELQPGRPIQSPQVHAALQFLLAFDRSPMAGLVDIKKVDVSLAGVLVATTEQGSELTFSPLGMEQQLRRWRGVYDASQNLGKVIGTLDLAVTNNIPVSWLEASLVPPTTPKAVKPVSKKRKHV